MNEKTAIGLARAYRQIYNYDETRRLLQRASAQHPKSGAALVELGRLDIHLQYYDQAVGELREAVQRQPSLVAAYVNLGVAYQAKGDQQKALEQFNRAIQRDPRSASAHHFRGMLYADQDDNEHAYADAHQAYVLDPAITASRVLLAKVATRVGKCAEAIDLLKPLTESESKETTNLYLLVRAYQCSNQAELARQAQSEFEHRSQQEEKGRRLKMEADHLAERAGDLARQNQLSPALELLNQALSKDPENGPTHAVLAKIEFSEGDIPKAHSEIEVALRTSPWNPDYLYVLGRVFERQQDWQGALEAFQKTVLANPKESDAYYEMGQIYMQRGDRARAVQALEKAVKLSPDDPDYKKALAELTGAKSQ